MIIGASRSSHLPTVLVKLYRHLKTHGMQKTVRRFRYLLHRETVVRFTEWRFDRKLSIQTAGIVKHPEVSSNPLHRFAVEYQGTSPRKFQEIMRSMSCFTMPDVFFDMGCGKGRVLFMAAQYSFKKVVGVEFSSELARVAVDNINRFNVKNPSETRIEAICADAAQYKFPDEDAVIFFFNPFHSEIMVKVLENIRKSARATKCRLIIYYNPVLAHLFAEPEHFALLVKEADYSIYRMLL